MDRPAGTLFIVATPIGHLDDLTIRARDVLASVDLVACEDTRRTGLLLKKYGLKKRLMSYFQPRERQKIPQIIQHLQSGGDVALVSDAGTPGLSDPGYPLIHRAIEEGITVVPIPGPCAAVAALSASGLPTDRFLFVGFPSPKKTALLKQLQSLSEERATIIFYLPPRKMESFLTSLQQILPERQVVVARELTKIYEEFLRGTAEELLQNLIPERLKGEATVLVEGKRR
ncbi:MAG: 16S rRNA (cytidine(1402)-2'-O)-methyltransferase [Candidatus Aminicenantes bacterium]|nr:16S rRNA (cytidine(1402)-2'-O)-methyltransferase [Candidatus Aminicenantes bacterium]